MSKPTIKTGNELYIESEHFTCKLEPFIKTTFQWFTRNDVGSYHMAISYENIDELIEFLKAIKANKPKNGDKGNE